MRQAPVGSMTTPSRQSADDLLAAQQRLLATALWHPVARQRAPLPLLPAKRALALHKLALVRAQAQAALATRLAQWAFTAPLDPRGAAEGWALGMAFWQQWCGLQGQWAEGLAELAEETGELRDANTVSKYMEQEVNLLQQGVALGTAQVARTLQLLENAQNNLSFWLARRSPTNEG